MQEEEQYVYPPLEDHQHAIRLIEIVGVDDQGYLNISLRGAVIQKGSYVALSYVWGIGPAVYKIKLNGRIVTVRQNLWSFLTNCESGGQLTWIDALCIDQSNVVEKNRQVPLMGRIFSHAEKVICWLHGGSAISALRDCNWEWIDRMDHADISKNVDLVAHDLLRFSQHRYWSRLWIVQELQLGQQIEVHWEGHIIDGDRLTYLMDIDALTESGVLRAAEFQDPDGCIVLRSLLSRRDAFLARETHDVDLFTLVLKYGNLLGSLLQDRVYALLALASNGASFAVDYTESCTTLLVRLLHHCDVLPDWRDILEVAHTLDIRSEQIEFEILGTCQHSNAVAQLHAERTFKRCAHCFSHRGTGEYPDLIIGIPGIIYFGLTNSYTMFGPSLLSRHAFVNNPPENYAGIAHTYSVSAVLDQRQKPQVLDSGELHLNNFALMKQSLSHFTFAASEGGRAMTFLGTIPQLLELLTSTKQNNALGRSSRWITCSEIDLQYESRTICKRLLYSYQDIFEVRKDSMFEDTMDVQAVPRVIKWKEALSLEGKVILIHFILIENQQVRTWSEVASIMKEYFLLRTDLSYNLQNHSNMPCRLMHVASNTSK